MSFSHQHNQTMRPTLLVIALLLTGAVAPAAEFHVDSSRSAAGDGSSANPWRLWNNIDWNKISTALASEPVTICFSSRGTWSSTGGFHIKATGTAAHPLALIGHQQYNLTGSGAAVWQRETNATQRAILNGSLYLGNGLSHITVAGFLLFHPPWGGVNLGTAQPTLDIHHITVESCVIDSPVHNHGVWFGYAESGCYDITVRKNVIRNTQLEGIYLGHYNFLTNTITGVLVEGNTLVDCGLSGEGDIDIKPAVCGAIIRYNTHYRTSPKLPGSNCGVVVGADQCQIYGNTFYAAAQKPASDWGHGIYVNADGDGTGHGQGITACLIYNNLVHGNSRAGIKLTANTATPDANITGVRIYNNLIWANGTVGLQASASHQRTVTIVEMKNNILGANTEHDISITGGARILVADHNLYFRATGSSWFCQGEKTWTAWKALGFDPHGLNTDPQLATNFRSPVAHNGADLSAIFTTDHDGKPRPRGAAWNIGPFQSPAISGR